MTSAHIIETLALECAFQDSELAWRMQARLEAFFHDTGLGILEEVFDRFDPQGMVWRMEELSVDLGVLRAEEDPETWGLRLKEHLEEQLRSMAPPEGTEALPETVGSRLPQIQWNAETFAAVLLRGNLPWSLKTLPEGGLDPWLERLLRECGTELWATLEQISASDQALERLEQLVSPERLHALLHLRASPLALQLARLASHILEPLQARGRLSAYEARRLRQLWTGAALRAVWESPELTPRGLAELQSALGKILQEALGDEVWRLELPWEELLRTESPELTISLVQGLLSPPGSAPGEALLACLAGDGSPERVPLRVWALVCNALLAGRPGDLKRFGSLLRQIRSRAPRWLQHTLRIWGLSHHVRSTWVTRLGEELPWNLLEALTPGTPIPNQPEALAERLQGRGLDAAALEESIRQFTLAARRQGPWPSGLDDQSLRALLLECTFLHVLQGGTLPQDHVAWQRFWQNALDRFLPPPSPSGNSSSPAAFPDPPELPDLPGVPEGLLEALRRGGAALARLRLADLMADPQVCETWLRESSESERWQLLDAVLPGRCQTLRTCSDQLLKAAMQHFPHHTSASIQEAHWGFLARHLLQQGLDPSPQILVRRYAHHLAQLERRPARSLWGRLERAFQKLTSWLRGSALARELEQSLAQAPTASEHWEAEQRPQLPQAPAEEPASGEPQAPIYIANAGLVLLAPFLERLFKNLGLTRDRAFVDDAARGKAIHCLEYLVWGHTDTPEPSWSLDRVLCGLPIARFVPPSPGLDESTSATLDSLLQAVIQHWKALGRTSIAGLRETFLAREGRLTRFSGESGEGWLLQVQEKAFDVLMDRLPWGISVIRLPWMEGVLHVEWH